MKLYSSPGSCSSASHILLLEAGADFEIEKLDLRTDRQMADGRHLNEVNPKGYVPVLELDDGSLLTENVAILQFIADQYPDSNLAPANGTMERYRLQEMLAFISTEIHKTIGNFMNPKLPDDMRAFFTQRLNGRFDYINTQLNGKDYLLGEQFTVVDPYLFIICSWAPMVGYDLSPYENVVAWQARVGARDSVKKALAPPS